MLIEGTRLREKMSIVRSVMWERSEGWPWAGGAQSVSITITSRFSTILNIRESCDVIRPARRPALLIALLRPLIVTLRGT